MTGFARLQKPTYAWEMRSVNHRGLEIRLKVPEKLWALENSLKDHVRRLISRGSVEIAFREQIPDHIESNDAPVVAPDVLGAIDEMCSILPTKKVVSVLDVTRLLQQPNLLRASLAHADYDLVEIESTFQSCLAQLRDVRKQEGHALHTVLQDSVTATRCLLVEINERSEDQPKLVQTRLLERVRELDTQIDPARVAQEVAMLVQKCDFKEEFDRLDIHLQDLEQCLQSSTPVGRRLNFLTQEILREANTLASKAQSPAVATLVIDLKVCVDQMREQVQNIE